MNNSRHATTYLLIWLLLVSCAPVVLTTPSPTAPLAVSPTVSPPFSPTWSMVEDLRHHLALDEQCPHICWAGINPGVTSAQEARAWLGTTQTEKYETSQSDTLVTVHFEKGLVKSISFERPYPHGTLGDYIQLLGTPDEIRITLWADQHCRNIAYLLYFSSRKTVLEIPSGIWTGPDPRDYWVYRMILNAEFDEAFLQSQPAYASYYNQFSERQPWLGYGHLSDYLPGDELPTGSCMPSEAAP